MELLDGTTDIYLACKILKQIDNSLTGCSWHSAGTLSWTNKKYLQLTLSGKEGASSRTEYIQLWLKSRWLGHHSLVHRALRSGDRVCEFISWPCWSGFFWWLFSSSSFFFTMAQFSRWCVPCGPSMRIQHYIGINSHTLKKAKEINLSLREEISMKKS